MSHKICSTHHIKQRMINFLGRKTNADKIKEKEDKKERTEATWNEKKKYQKNCGSNVVPRQLIEIEEKKNPTK